MKVLYPMMLLGLVITGCSGGGLPEAIKSMNSGEKVVLNNENTQNYLIVKLEYFIRKDSEQSIVRIDYKFETKGYSELSYFIDSITCTVSYTYLGDDGNMTEGQNKITSNPGKDGKSETEITYNCSYRSVNNIHLSYLDCSGFVVKK